MKTTIGGDRLGSGAKQEVSFKNYSRSSHDLSSTWRSSMSAGTLVPFMSLPALPGDSFDIDLQAEVLTLPAVGPLFGSFKVQLDVFQIPMRIYNAMLHMNRLEIGNNMSQVLLPQLKLRAVQPTNQDDVLKNDYQINSSSLVKYLGISGIGKLPASSGFYNRDFNAIPYLGYWDIYKNYYSNKQEERGFCIHTDNATLNVANAVIGAQIFDTSIGGGQFANCFNSEYSMPAGTTPVLNVIFGNNAAEINPDTVLVIIDGGTAVPMTDNFTNINWTLNTVTNQYNLTGTYTGTGAFTIEVESQNPQGEAAEDGIRIQEFDLANIDEMKLRILQHSPQSTPFIISTATTANGLPPYANETYTVDIGAQSPDNTRYSVVFSQENLGLKTYQSDLFNNWISTEWLDGANGVNAVTAVDTTGDSFTIDSLNLSKKVYIMLNRIAISGGTYDDWLDAVYEHERPRSMESPLYHGSLIKELAFEEVISNAATDIGGTEQPLGELGGRGRLTGKNKGGSMKIKVHEPSYIMGIVSITPRIEYSQGNVWDTNLKTFNDFHKPALDAIGFQELITEQLAWQATNLVGNDNPTFTSVGKQPAWINYMTDVDRVFGNFAAGNTDDFMVLNRDYEIGETGIKDLTTYIDPSKYNYIFAQTDLTAQNFWVHIGKKIIARRKMSAKVIPNL